MVTVAQCSIQGLQCDYYHTLSSTESKEQRLGERAIYLYIHVPVRGNIKRLAFSIGSQNTSLTVGQPLGKSNQSVVRVSGRSPKVYELCHL